MKPKPQPDKPKPLLLLLDEAVAMLARLSKAKQKKALRSTRAMAQLVQENELKARAGSPARSRKEAGQGTGGPDGICECPRWLPHHPDFPDCQIILVVPP